VYMAHKGNRPSGLTAYAVLIASSVVLIVPFTIACFMSFKVILAVPAFSLNILRNLTLDSYKHIISRTKLIRWIANSITVAGSVTAIKLFIDSLAGYTFAKKQFLGKELIFTLLLSTVMIPFAMMLIPLFILTKSLGMVNTYAGLILPMLGSPVGIFLMRQYIETIPSELQDSGRIDGCSEFAIYLRIFLPICTPALTLLTVFTFMFQWTNFIWPLVITTSDSMRTTPVGLATLRGQYLTNWGAVFGGALISIVPITIVFVFAQRYFIEGLTVGAIKG
jgi:multiple sugar transport system permease protein